MIKKIFAVFSIIVACLVIPISCSLCRVNADTSISLTAYDDTVPDTPVWTPDIDNMPQLTDIGDYSTDIGLLKLYRTYSVVWSTNNVNLNYVQEVDNVTLGRFYLTYTTSYIDTSYGHILGLNSVSLIPKVSSGSSYYFESEHSIDLSFNTNPTTNSANKSENVTISKIRFAVSEPYIHNFSEVNLVVNYIFRDAETNAITNVIRFENVTYNDSGYTTNYVFGNMYIDYLDLYSQTSTSAPSYYTPRVVDNASLQRQYYRIGYIEGAMYGYDVGYGDGYGDGYYLGYEDGFQDGLDVDEDIDAPMLAIVNGANALLDIQLFGAFSVRDMLGIVLALSFLFIGIHLFRG